MRFFMGGYMFFIQRFKALFFLMSLILVQSASATSFYITAHQDDALLFMARNGWNDVASGSKTVFVVITAGDGGRLLKDFYDDGTSHPYYLSRQAGLASALRYWYGFQGHPVYSDQVSYVTIAGRRLTRTQIGGMASNLIMYNLYLPDAGLKAFRKDSLTNTARTITAIDNSQTFTWINLKSFLISLIQTEQDAYTTWVNVPEFTDNTGYDANGNYTAYIDGHYDHDDHIETGRVVTHALRDYASQSPSRCIMGAYWIGYYAGDQHAAGNPSWPLNYGGAPNISGTEQYTQDTTWKAYSDAVAAAGGPAGSEYLYTDPAHRKYLFLTYPSSMQTVGYGPC
jgi:hypothetical protein